MENYKNKTITRYPSGQTERCEYGFGSILHRTNGPARITFHKSGRPHIEQYYINGKTHRTDGPAIIWYDKQGKVTNRLYVLNDTFADIKDLIDCMSRSENKTETFMKLLQSNPETRRPFATVAINMFKNELSENIVKNIDMFG